MKKNKLTKPILIDQIIRKLDIIGLYFGLLFAFLFIFSFQSNTEKFKLLALLTFSFSFIGWFLGWTLCIYFLSNKENDAEIILTQQKISSDAVLTSLANMTNQIKTISNYINKK